MEGMASSQERLHVVLLPWLAFGHMRPYFELSLSLARKGHKISFISTPKNIKRLPKVLPTLSSLMNLVNLPLPHDPNLPEAAESTMDVPHDKFHLLKNAFDGLQEPVASFLEASSPDCIIFDYAAYWVPPMAAKLGVPCACFITFTASTMCFFGSFSLSKSDHHQISFPFDLAFRPYEISRNMRLIRQNNSVSNSTRVHDGHRFSSSIQGCDILVMRTCKEFESEWLNLLESEVYKKPVLPVGLLPPETPSPSQPEDEDEDEDEDGEYSKVIKDWLDKQVNGSVVYVALGTEAILSNEEATELALGLELSELPFFWVLRNDINKLMLPDGFEERTGERGLIHKGWVPQVKILAHSSIGAFVTHCGWNSVIEGLAFGCPLVLLPLINDQPLVARLLEWKKIGIEIPRKEEDGLFTKAGAAQLLRSLMVEEKGKRYREKAAEMQQVFGNKALHDQYVEDFASYIENK